MAENPVVRFVSSAPKSHRPKLLPEEPDRLFRAILVLIVFVADRHGLSDLVIREPHRNQAGLAQHFRSPLISYSTLWREIRESIGAFADPEQLLL